MTNYNKILDRAKALIDAIEDNKSELWEPQLENAHNAVLLNDSKVRMDYDTTFEYNGISKQIDALKESIKKTEKAIYDSEPKNHPIWRELGVDPENNRGYESDIEWVDGDPDPDCGWEIWKSKYDEIDVWIEIETTSDEGRDFSDPIIMNYKSYKDTIKWLRDRDVDVDNELSDDYIIDEAHGFEEIAPFNDGYIIKGKYDEIWRNYFDNIRPKFR